MRPVARVISGSFRTKAGRFHPILGLLSAIILLASLAIGRADEIKPRIQAPSDFPATKWFNSSPLDLKGLRGKVVLVDFWEYTCINCIRTFPYLRRWNELYGPDGLVIVGVHTPEFAFAKNPKNVADAVKRFGFKFPIAVDSDYKIWNEYNNNAWPADYLIDKDGRIALIHLGEGDYGDFEMEIRKLLKEANPKLDFSTARYVLPADANADMFGAVCRRATPETYLGAARGSNNANPGGEDRTREVHYLAPAPVPSDSYALNGDWLAGDEYVRHNRASNDLHDAVELHYQAKAVYLVAGSDDAKARPLYIMQDGAPLPRNSWGVDVKSDSQGRPYVELRGKRMYYVVENPEFGDHTLSLYAITPNVSLYSFTFGNNCENKFAHK